MYGSTLNQIASTNISIGHVKTNVIISCYYIICKSTFLNEIKTVICCKYR